MKQCIGKISRYLFALLTMAPMSCLAGYYADILREDGVDPHALVQVAPEQSMGAIPSVLIAGIVGAFIFYLASPKVGLTTPSDIGRKWFAWAALIICLAILPNYIRDTSDDVVLVKWGIDMVFFGGGAFLLGWAYGKFFKTWDTAPSSASKSEPAPPTGVRSSGDIKSVPRAEPTINEPPPVNVDRIYAQVAKEIESGNADKGLWTRLWAECNGDDKQTKLLYIKQRAKVLIATEKARLLEEQIRKMKEKRSKENDQTNTEGNAQNNSDAQHVKHVKDESRWRVIRKLNEFTASGMSVTELSHQCGKCGYSGPVGLYVNKNMPGAASQYMCPSCGRLLN